ncbi:MAG: hypothetical protein K8S23_03980 [Candidatus Cloacimonetes bacterium]|nr:hypothetical protein [Candidatus Cloacimonadota bacterium]
MLELDILKDVITKLQNIQIEYMLTGSMAMNYYAEPRMTRDLDIIIKININDIKKIVSVFQNEYYISEEAIHESVKHNSSFNIIH